MTNVLSILLEIFAASFAAAAVVFTLLGVRNIRKAQKLLHPISDNAVPAIGEGLLAALHQQVKIEQESSMRIPVLKQRRLVGDRLLTQAAADIGVADLEILLSTLRKVSGHTPYLVGVNKGGSLVANFLAHRLGLHEKYLIKCDYRPDYEKLYCENRPIANGHIVIIDDVVRTGKTITSVKQYFVDTYPNASVFSLCLVCVYTNEPEAPPNPVDYCAWIAKSENIEMPWSGNAFRVATDAVVEPKSFIFNDHEIDQIVGQSQQSALLAS
jgi:pyrimidine operon attenuation protein/uracil phosphoribosyltransferase